METPSKIIPDGGLAWLVVSGAWGTIVFCNSLNSAYGALLPLVVESFGANYATAAWIGGLSDALLHASSPLSIALSQHYGNRKIVLVGIVIVSIGLLLSSFAPTAEILALTYGCLTGVGMSLTYGPAVVEVSKYFDKRRAVALSLMFSGTGTSNFIIPILVNFLEQEYALRGCFLILSAYTLEALVFGALLRDWTFRESPLRPLHDVESQNTLARTDTCESNLPEIESDQSYKLRTKVPTDNNNYGSGNKLYLPENRFAARTGRQDAKVHPLKSKPLEFEAGIDNNINNKMDTETPATGRKWLECNVVGKLCFRCNANDDRPAFFDCSLVRDRKGLLYLTLIALLYSTDTLCYSVLVSHAEDNGVANSNAQTMLSVAGGVNVLSILFIGWFVDRRLVSGKVVYAFLGVCGGCCAITLASVETETMLWVCSVLIGIFVRATPPVQVIMLADVFGLEKLHSTFGIAGFFKAVSGMTIPYVIGLLRDSAGSWSPGLYISGGTALTAGVTILVEAAINRKSKGSLTEA